VKSALELVPAQPPSAARARLLQMLSARFLMEGRFDQAAQVGVETIAAARAVGELEAEFRAHNILAPSLVHIGRVDEGLATFETARRLAGDVPRRLVSYYINVSDALHLLGRYAEAARNDASKARTRSCAAYQWWAISAAADPVDTASGCASSTSA
jgi:hypothetical protein